MLRIKRQSMFVDMMRDYKVFVDGTLVGTVSNGETAVFELTPGHHLVHLEIDWCKSPKISLDVKHQDTINLLAGSSMKWFNFPFLYLFKLSLLRNRYVSLKQEQLEVGFIEMKYNEKLRNEKPQLGTISC